MRGYDQLVFDEQIAGTEPVYSHPRFDPLLGALDQFALAVQCSQVSGESVTLRIDAEHGNTGQHWLPKSGVISTTALAADLSCMLLGQDDYDAPTGAYARLRIRLSGDQPAATLRIRVCARKLLRPTGVLWGADFTAYTPGALPQLPGELRLTRGSIATVQTSLTTVRTASVASNVARVGDDGLHSGLVLEEARTNLLLFARSLNGANWTPGASETLTTNAADGPDAAVLSANREEVLKDGYGSYDTQPNATAGAYALSSWVKRGSVSATHQLCLRLDSGSTNVAVGGTAPTAWRRFAVAGTHSAGTVWSIPVDGRDWSSVGGIANGARDALVDLVQLEAGSFPTEVIETAGSAKSRADERLYHPSGAALVSSGRLGLEVRVQPKGSSTQYSVPMRLWTVDASNYAEISNTTRKITLVIGGSSFTFPTAMTWSAGDTLELWVVGGGGALVSNAQYRVNAGATTDLGSTGSPHGALAPGGEIDLLCNGAANVFSAWVQRLRTYVTGWSPRWTL